MAYLLHPASFAAPAAHDADGSNSAAGSGLIGSVRSLLQGIHATLHGEPTRTYGQSSARRPTQESCAGVGSAAAGLNSQVSYSAPSRPSSASAARLSNTNGGSHGRSKAPILYGTNGLSAATAAAAAAPATASAAPTNAVDAAVSDAELYRRAVDFADVEEVLRCPLPPVEGCPTPCAYGGRLSTTSRAPPSPLSAPLAPAASPAASMPSHASSPTPPLTFRCIAADADTGITIYSTPVEECPMHLMRAYAILPCAPREVLQYMDNDVRPQWDSYIRRSALLRELPPPEVPTTTGQTLSLSSSLATPGLGRLALPTSLATRTQLHRPGRAAPSSTSARGFAYEPGQRRVAIHYLETRSPVPFVQDRDFELVVAEEVLPDGTAYSKALSTPFGYHMPLDPQQSRYVRAVVLLSGLVARPLDPMTAAEVLPPVLRRHRTAAAAAAAAAAQSTKGTTPQPEYCVLEYIGLVHPMGMLPAVLVNVVISAQLNAMRKMQTFISRHPMSALRPRGVSSGVGDGVKVLQPTVPALKELSVALRSTPLAETAGEADAQTLTPRPVSECKVEEGERTGKLSEPSEFARSEGGSTLMDAGRKDAGAAGGLAESPRPPPQPLRQQRSTTPKRWWRWRPGFLASRL